MKKPLICILVLNWNGEEVIGNCLKSLERTSYPNHKIIVIDNGSTDNSKEIISKFKKAELIDLKENKGYTSGFNYGWDFCLKKYDPEYICNLNNDLVVVQKNWLDLMVKELEKNKQMGICENQETFPEDYFDKEYKKLKVKKTEKVKEISLVGGASMLVKKELIKKIGGLDENFFFGPDDKDFGLRAIKAGFKIIRTDFSRYVHLGSHSYSKSNKDFIYKHQSYGEMLYYFRHGSISNKIKMVFKQFLRIFFSYGKDSRNAEIKFHKSFLKRFFIFWKSFFSAMKSYKNIKISEEYEMLKI
jgi:GT2 family glycosyltransferase